MIIWICVSSCNCPSVVSEDLCSQVSQFQEWVKTTCSNEWFTKVHIRSLTCLTCREVTDGKMVGDRNYCFFTQIRLWLKSVKLRDGRSQYLTPNPTVFINIVVAHGQNFRKEGVSWSKLFVWHKRLILNTYHLQKNDSVGVPKLHISLSPAIKLLHSQIQPP